MTGYARPLLHKLRDVDPTGIADGFVLLWAAAAGKHVYAEISPATIGAEPAGTAAAEIAQHIAAADPHEQYALDVAVDAALTAKSNVGHGHVIADVAGLQSELDAKALQAGWDAGRVMVANDAGQLAASSITTALLGFLAGLTGSVQTQLNGKSDIGHGHSQGAIAGLTETLLAKADLVDGVLATSQIPAVAISEFLGRADDEAAMILLVGQRGDYCYRTDLQAAMWLTADDPTLTANWLQVALPSVSVQSVNGQTGVIVLGYADVGAASTAHNHAIADVSGLQTALDGKAATSHNQTKATITDLETITVTPTASAVPKADAAGKLDPKWVDMLNVTLGASTASKAVTADANGRVGLGRAASSGKIEVAQEAGDASPGIRVFNNAGSGSLDVLITTAGTVALQRSGQTFMTQNSARTVGINAVNAALSLVSNAGLGIGAATMTPTAMLDVDSDTTRLRTKRTITSSTAAGNQGDSCWDDNYEYRCTSTNTWKRIPLSSW